MVSLKRKEIYIIAFLFLTFLFSGCVGRNIQPAEDTDNSVSLENSEIKDGIKDTEEIIRTARDIEKEIIEHHGAHGYVAEDRVEKLLEELKSVDEREAEFWEEIIGYWDYANNEMPINDEFIPDDLPADKSLCIVVLGFQLNPDGSMKEELVGRLNAAKECAEKYPEAYVICTGGGTAANNPGVSEGGQMGKWLLENGIEENRIIIEDRSLTTAENAVNSYKILSGSCPEVNSVMIVSSDYHIPWGSLMFETAFRKAVYEKGTVQIRVISNYAYKTDNDKITDASLLQYEASGMKQLMGLY